MTISDAAVPPRIVATRIFRNQAGNEVIATVYEPVKTPDDWKCEFRISGLPQEVVEHAPGMDSFQALMIAMHGIRLHLDGVGDVLTWVGGETGALGIPRVIPDSFGVEAERRFEKVVEDEVMRVAEEKVMARRASRDEDKPKGGK